MQKFWNWLQDRLGIHGIAHRITNIEDAVEKLSKKATVKPRRYDQIERDRSRRRHPARHHDIRRQAD